MNIYNVSFFLSIFFSTVFFNKLLAQDSIKISKYVEKTITTILEYHKIPGDSIEKKYGGMDSLINNTAKMQWSTVLKANENKLMIANRTLKRMQVAYLNQLNYFFDSGNPIKFSGFLSGLNEISDNLLNKNFKEVIPVSTEINNEAISFINKPHLYNISPYDTAKYISSIFFLQTIPFPYKENDKWEDTSITEKSVLLNTFTIKSLSKSNLNLHFKCSIVVLNHKRDNQSDSNNDKLRINVVENSTTTEGYMSIDPSSHFIYSIEATITRKMESNVNGKNKKNSTVISNFTLYNKIE